MMLAAEWALVGCCIAGLILIFSPRVKAQQLNPGDLSPGPIHCQGAQKHIKTVLSKAGMFKDAFALSGEGARQVSQNIFNLTPPADHIIIIRQNNGGSIMVPCVWGRNGPEWDGKRSTRIKVEVDFKFANEIANPKTELPDQPSGVDELPKRTRGAKK